MNITIRNPQKAECFASIFQHIKSFTDHINILFEKERMYVQSMDSSHVSIFEITIPSTWFDSYIHEYSNSVTIGISSSLFYKILNTRDKSQMIQLVFNSKNEDKLNIHFTSEEKTNFDKHFEIPLIDIEVEMLEIPVIEYQAEFSISSLHFASIVNQLKMFGDNMDMQCSEEKIALFSNSPDNGKMFVDIQIDDLTSFAIDEGENLISSFSLNFLHNICLYNKLSKEIEIKLRADYPLKLIYYLGDENTKMVFYLAPKISEED